MSAVDPKLAAPLMMDEAHNSHSPVVSGLQLAALRSNESKGVEIAVDKLAYTVKGLRIVKEVSFLVKPGEMCACIGPSGAGKTTVLDLVAGRKTGGTQSGDILFNGHPRNRFFTRISAYVMQSDVHIASLTVYETMMYAVRLRMDASMADRRRRVQALLDVLGLAHIKDQAVGDDLTRGISGGQRKRLSIGVEISSMPDLLFLDEATSGLDSEMALEVMSCVRDLANQRRTILATIHQPSPQTFELFDKVVYFGPRDRVVRYFSSAPINCVFKEHSNPADFALSVASGKATREGERSQSMAPGRLAQIWAKCEEAAAVEEAVENSRSNVGPDVHFSRTLPTTVLEQARAIAHRTAVKLLRDKKTRRTLVLRSIVVSLFMGSLFYQQDTCGELVEFNGRKCSSDCIDPHTFMPTPESESCRKCSEAVYNRFSMLFFSLLFLMMGNLQAIAGLCEERLLFYRERAAGAYSTYPYLFATTLANVPLMVLSNLAFCAIIYYLVGFDHASVEFLFFVMVCFLVYLLGFCWAQMLAALTPTPDVALALFPLTFIFFNVFAGFLIHVPEVPRGWKWATEISFVRWAVQAVVINEFEKQDQLRYFNGSDVLAQYGYDKYSKWESVWILLGMVATVRLITYLSMRFVRFGST